MILVGNQFFGMNDLGTFVYDLIFDQCAFANGTSRKNYAVFNYGVLLDDTSAADDRVFDRTFDQTAVGDNGITYAGSLEVLRRAGIVGFGINWPI